MNYCESGSNFLNHISKLIVEFNHKMEENVAKFKEILAKSRTEADVSHALYNFQKNIHPYSCTQTGRKQLVIIFQNIWEIFISIIQKYSSSTMVRVATFTVASTFLIRMTPFFPFQIRQSFSYIVSNETFLETSASLFLISNSTQSQQDPTKKSNDKAMPAISTASNVSVLLAAAFSFITHFISPESIGEFLEASPIFHHFVDRNALESDHLPTIISNICDNVGISWYRSLLFGLMTVNSIHKNWSRGTIKAIYAIIKHSPSILLNDFLQFFLTNNKDESNEIHLDTFELTLVSFLMTSDVNELNDIDFLPFAKLALNIVANFSMNDNSTGTQTQIENAMQILSVKTRSFRLKIKQVSDDSIEITLFKGRTAIENKSMYRKNIEEEPVYLSNDEIGQILKDFDKNQKENPKDITVSEDEDFGLNDEDDDVEINKHLESSASIPALFNLLQQTSTVYMPFSQSDPMLNIGIPVAKTKPISRSFLASEKVDTTSESSEVTLFKSDIPFTHVGSNLHSNTSEDNDVNTIIEKITIKFEPLMKYVSFYLLPLPIDPFLLPNKHEGEESFAIFSAKINAIASFFSDSNRIIDDIHTKSVDEYDDSIDEKTLNFVISMFDGFLLEKYDIKVSAILQALPKCINCFLMNTKDPKFIGILRRVLFAPITSWFHALEILRVIEAINPDLIDFAFGQRVSVTSGLKEIVELILDMSTIQKYEKLIDPCYNIIIKMTTKKNYYHIVDILLEHVDLFNSVSIQRHLDIIYALIQQYDNKSHKPRKHYPIIQHHCFKFFEILSFYADDLPTISSIFHFLSLYDSSELFLRNEKDDEKIGQFKNAVSLSKLIVNAGVTYLLGMPKTEEIAVYYDKIESYFISQSIEVTRKGVTDYKKQFKCIHAPMSFIFSLPQSLVPLEDQFIFDLSRRLFRFFPSEVTHFLYAMNKSNQKAVDGVQNSLFHDILIRMDAMKDINIHAMWCKMFIKFRFSTKNLDKSLRRIMNSIVFLLRNNLDKLTVHEISDFLNFVFLFDKASYRFILRTIASLDRVKRIHFFKIASNPIKEMFVSYFPNDIQSDVSINYRNDYHLLNKLFKNGSIDHIVKRINKDPRRLQFYQNNLNGWVLLFIIKSIDQPKNDKTKEIESEISHLPLTDASSKDSLESEMKNLSFPQLSFSHLNDYVYIWRPFNPYFRNYIKSRKERLSMKLQSGCDDAIQLFLRINNVKSEEITGLSIQPTALPYVIKHLYKREPNCDFLRTTIIQSLTIDDILTSKKAAILEAMHINPSFFLQQFQIKQRLKKKQLFFLASFLSQQKIKTIRRKPQKITSKTISKDIQSERPKENLPSEVHVISADDSKDSFNVNEKDSENSLLYALMLRLFEGEKKISRIKCILSLIAVLISTSSMIPFFFLRSFTEFIFVDLNRTLTGNNQASIEKLVSLPEEVGLVFSTLGQRQCSAISFDMNDQILHTSLNSAFAIEIDDDIRHYLFTFHRNVQSFYSPSFAEIFLLTYSVTQSTNYIGHRIGMSNSQLSSELEADLRLMLQSLEIYPTLPSNLFHSFHIFNAISFWPIPLMQQNARGFVKNHYQILFVLSKDQIWNPFIIENLLKLSLGFLLDNSNGYTSLNTRQFAYNFIRDFIMENFFKPFINEINNNSASNQLRGCPYWNILLHFLRLICWSPSSNVEMLSLAFSISEAVPNHFVSYTEFNLYMSILKIYLNTIEKKDSRKLIVLNSINTWIRSLSNSICQESYDSFKFMVYYIHLMDKMEIDIDTILQVINEQFEEKFSFFPFFLSFAIYVKYLHSIYHNDEVKFEDSDVGQKMLAILCDSSHTQEMKYNFEALRELISGNYKNAFKAMMK